MFKSYDQPIKMSKISYYTSPFLSGMRQQTDPLADQAVKVLSEDKSHHFRKLLSTLNQNDYVIPSGLPSEVTEFLEKTRHLPGWANLHRIEKGARFFAQHAPGLMSMLGLFSLPYCYAAAHGARVLYFSERLRHNPGKRLAETGQYILDVTGKNAFASSGKAICSTQKVRLMHAAIRYHIQKSSQWNNEAWGKPVNQEDMAGTNLAISLIAVRGLRKMSVRLSYDEVTDYMHLWNVAGFIMGIDERLLPDTGKEAFLLDKMIATRQFESSGAGRALTASLLKYMAQQTTGPMAGLAPAYMRFLLGDKVANALAIPKAEIGSNITLNGIRALNRVRNIGGYSEKNRYRMYTRLRQQPIRPPD